MQGWRIRWARAARRAQVDIGGMDGAMPLRGRASVGGVTVVAAVAQGQAGGRSQARAAGRGGAHRHARMGRNDTLADARRVRAIPVAIELGAVVVSRVVAAAAAGLLERVRLDIRPRPIRVLGLTAAAPRELHVARVTVSAPPVGRAVMRIDGGRRSAPRNGRERVRQVSKRRPDTRILVQSGRPERLCASRRAVARKSGLGVRRTIPLAWLRMWTR